ncbi:uncharacterized protein CIMG_13572 [Coccidioides immitis RS]|uniref:Cyanovirin-N domain-containing protein n=5 Tax=Coccidioides TaxID=5500 RepID=J3K1I6_COCIM|nr:uncharacterized protein CIMG_13572 [Coccidioides immitis RS]KMM71666.1 hypothetical protein CPAG_07969 [Coccidioides posadasii RMSCC 3488]KMP08630.1 hypothetical protein CIRG_08311 [Coccidioides immitis RMSCC 2394]KMU78633.1 hypothetical protein CISG_01673 [Coccidioides immitis RMSCC 3703]KMU87450.1 hypothetical protein CIHG_05245 [Coccidioides immitis H538.4]TPX20543.1 hypothetical protein DIZ76_016435 [Coccidioides immitis]
MKFLNALPLLLSSISPAAIAVPLADNFSKSCDILGVQQNTLTALCQAPRGEIRTSLDLNHCFANSDGQIVARNEGYFHNSCNYCGGTGEGILRCFCNKKGSGQEDTKIDMNAVVKNIDGHLTCYGHRGS